MAAMLTDAPSSPRGRAPEPALVLLWLGMAIALAPFVGAAVVNVDEFTYLSHGRRVLAGQVPYRDFFEFVPPLSSYLAAAVFSVFGPSVGAVRVVQAVLLLVAGAGLYGVARRLGVGRVAACVPGLMFVLTLFRAYPIYSHHWLAVAGSVVAIAGFSKALAGRPAWAFGAGLAAGCALLSTQSDGVAVCAALVGGLVAAAWAGAERRGLWRILGLGLLGTVVPLGLAGGYLAWHGALGAAVQNMVGWTAANYKQVGGFNDVTLLADAQAQLAALRGELGTPFAIGRVLYLAGLLLVYPAGLLSGVWLGLRARRAGDATAAGVIGALGVWAGFGLVVALAGRADFVHLAMYAVPALLLVVLGAWAWSERHRAGQSGTRWAVWVAIAVFGLSGCVMTARSAWYQPGAWLVPAGPDARLAETPVIRFIRGHSGPGDRIVSLPWGGYHYFYGRSPASRFTLMLPPQYRYNPPAEYAAARAEILTERPKLVILSIPGGIEDLPVIFPDFDLPGYRLVASLPTPIGERTYVAHCFERVDR